MENKSLMFEHGKNKKKNVSTKNIEEIMKKRKI